MITRDQWVAVGMGPSFYYAYVSYHRLPKFKMVIDYPSYADDFKHPCNISMIGMDENFCTPATNFLSIRVAKRRLIMIGLLLL